MLKALLDANVASVRRRIAQGDCPTEPALSVETLEHMVAALSRAAPSSGHAMVEGERVRDRQTGQTGVVIRVSYSVQYDEPDGTQGVMGGSEGVCEYRAEDIETVATTPPTPKGGLPGRGEVPLFCMMDRDEPVAIARCEIARGQIVTADMLKNVGGASAEAIRDGGEAAGKPRGESA